MNEKEEKRGALPIDERHLKVDLNQSLKDRIIERWGCKVGNKFVCCFQDAIAKGSNRTEVLELLRKCLAKEIEEGEITEEELTSTAVDAEHFGTLGR